MGSNLGPKKATLTAIFSHFLRLLKANVAQYIKIATIASFDILFNSVFISDPSIWPLS
jgi:hypothetical protein